MIFPFPKVGGSPRQRCCFTAEHGPFTWEAVKLSEVYPPGKQHRIHGTCIFTYICHKIQPNVGKYKIAPENWWSEDAISFFWEAYFQGQTVSWRKGIHFLCFFFRGDIQRLKMYVSCFVVLLSSRENIKIFQSYPVRRCLDLTTSPSGPQVGEVSHRDVGWPLAFEFMNVFIIYFHVYIHVQRINHWNPWITMLKVMIRIRINISRHRRSRVLLVLPTISKHRIHGMMYIYIYTPTTLIEFMEI